MLLLAEALVKLSGQGVLARRRCTQGGKGRERRSGTQGTKDLAAADELPVKLGKERIHDCIFSETAEKDQQELTEGLKPLRVEIRQRRSNPISIQRSRTSLRLHAQALPAQGAQDQTPCYILLW
jgi:hypothetical protein